VVFCGVVVEFVSCSDVLPEPLAFRGFFFEHNPLFFSRVEV